MSPQTAEKNGIRKSQPLAVKVLNASGKAVSDYRLDSFVFDGKVNQTLMHQAVTIYRANQRKGLAHTKTRGEVSGGGTKPWRQKGTGRARVGSIRSPIWRGGGITFGPRSHSFHKKLPKKMKALAFKSALNAKYRANQIVIIEDVKLDSHKTKSFFKILRNLGLDNAKAHFILEAIDTNIQYASRNIANVSLVRAQDVHTVDILDCKRLIVTKGALQILEERVKKCLQ